MDASAAVERDQFLGFLVAGDEYAIPILRVREILRYEPVTRVPTTPPFIRGVMNVRGSVVPVIDLAVKLGLGEQPVTRWTCIVIVEIELRGERVRLGLVADSVSRVIELAPGEIEPTPPFGVRINLEFLRGMGKLEKRFVLVLELERVLSAEELLVAAELPAAQGAAEPEGAA